jgi:hypothetical protein
LQEAGASLKMLAVKAAIGYRKPIRVDVTFEEYVEALENSAGMQSGAHKYLVDGKEEYWYCSGNNMFEKDAPVVL